MNRTQEIGKQNGRSSLLLYVLGFLFSLILTMAAYLIVNKNFLTHTAIIASIISLGVLQAFIQLLFFLHLGRESRPRLNLLVFLFMTLVVVIIVGGSLWIMYNLNERVMTME